MNETASAAAGLGDSGRAGFRLEYAELLNWGTFDNQVWRFTPRAETALLTGDIGSGKSTIVDALTTLLVPSHKAAYNKAAGAEAKERTLRSYVEGHYKSERNETTGKSRAKGLRENRRTYSVLLGVFTNHGYDETVTLAQVFQQRESAGQPYRFFVTATKQLTIAADFAEFGSDLRDLRRRLRGAGAEIFDEFPKYATSLRRLLGIRSEQALELFHQTVSMKSVGNLNDFVRDHMLEPSDATERVRDIIAHFEDLTKAHDAVRRAREQLEAFEPIVATAAKYDAALGERDAMESERSAVRVFIAELRSGLLADEIARLEADCADRAEQLAAAEAGELRLKHERESLIEERAKAGEIASASCSGSPTRPGPKPKHAVIPGHCSTMPCAAPGSSRSPTGPRMRHCPPWSPPNARDGRTRNEPWTRPPPRRSGSQRTTNVSATRSPTSSPAWSSAPATCRQSRSNCAPTCVQPWVWGRRIFLMPGNFSTYSTSMPNGGGGGTSAAWICALAASSPTALRRRHPMGQRPKTHLPRPRSQVGVRTGSTAPGPSPAVPT